MAFLELEIHACIETTPRASKTTIFSKDEVFEVVVMVTRSYYSFIIFLKLKKYILLLITKLSIS